jgi:hypothetical protein
MNLLRALRSVSLPSSRSRADGSSPAEAVELQPEGAEVRVATPYEPLATGSGVRRLGWSPTALWPRPTETPCSYADASRVISAVPGQFYNFSLSSSSSLQFINEGPPANMFTPVGAFLARERPFINATASPPLSTLAGPLRSQSQNSFTDNDNDDTILAIPLSGQVSDVVLDEASAPVPVSQDQADDESVVSFLSCAPYDDNVKITWRYTK